MFVKILLVRFNDSATTRAVNLHYVLSNQYHGFEIMPNTHLSTSGVSVALCCTLLLAFATFVLSFALRS